MCVCVSVRVFSYIHNSTRESISVALLLDCPSSTSNRDISELPALKTTLTNLDEEEEVRVIRLWLRPVALLDMVMLNIDTHLEVLLSMCSRVFKRYDT